MIKKVCEICGNEYFVKNYRANKSRFCSRQCQGKYFQKTFLINVDKSYLKNNKFRKGKLPTNAYQKGHIAWNKGIKGLHLSKKTEFKKGRENTNRKEVGTIAQRKKGTGKLRNYIKVAEPNKWELYAVYLVKQEGILIKKGCVVHHLNKNCLDDRIENLIVLTRAEHINIHREDLVSNNRLNKTDANGQMCMFLK